MNADALPGYVRTGTSRAVLVRGNGSAATGGDGGETAFMCFSRPARGHRDPARRDGGAHRPVGSDARRPSAYRSRLLIFEPSHTSGSYLRSTARSFKGISALSVILMPSGQTSVQHLVMLQ